MILNNFLENTLAISPSTGAPNTALPILWRRIHAALASLFLGPGRLPWGVMWAEIGPQHFAFAPTLGSPPSLINLSIHERNGQRIIQELSQWPLFIESKNWPNATHNGRVLNGAVGGSCLELAELAKQHLVWAEDVPSTPSWEVEISDQMRFLLYCSQSKSAELPFQ